MYRIDVRHDGLKKYRSITGRDKSVVEEKARVQIAVWNDLWERQISKERKLYSVELKKSSAITRSADAKKAIEERERILIDGLKGKCDVDWGKLKRKNPFPETPPDQPSKPTLPDEPLAADPQFEPTLGFLDRLFPSRRRRIEKEAANLFLSAHQEWERICSDIKAQISQDQLRFTIALDEWKKQRNIFNGEQNEYNNEVDAFQKRYHASDPQGIIDYYDVVLSNSSYPDCFPREWLIDYEPETGIVIVDYRLPSINDMPTLKEVKYVASRNSFDEILLKDSAINALYDSVIYQICLRTIHEIYTTDVINAIKSICFNGWVEYVNPATGLDTRACIVSLQITPDEFKKINLLSVEPKACFRSLKGVGSSKLHAMAPVQPLIQMSREDRRFVASVDLTLMDGNNLLFLLSKHGLQARIDLKEAKKLGLSMQR